MQEPSPWEPPRADPGHAPQPKTTKDASKLPMFCLVVAIVDVSMGGLTLLAAPMALFSFLVLPEGAPLKHFVVPGMLVAMLVGGFAAVADIGMLKKKPWAVAWGYANVAMTLIGVIYIWVQLPATIESQKMQMANTPGGGQVPAGMENMMAVSAVAGAVVTTLVRLALIVLVLIAIKKFKAWLSQDA